MSKEIGQDNGPMIRDEGDGIEALRQGSEFTRHLNEDLEHDHSNGHFAVVHETEAERTSATVPFIRQGIDRGERCLYVLDYYTHEEIVEVLEDAGIDVKWALESGALEFHTVKETYLRDRPFDPEQMVAFYEQAVEEATVEYEGLRVVAGTNWIDNVPIQQFFEYEGRVNALFDESDAMALCHYDRSQLPPEVIRDVIRTHPHLINNGTISHNVYYTPADEIHRGEEPSREVDRMLGTLNSRARAKGELTDHKRFLQELNEITSNPARPFEEKLRDLFDLGCEWFDLELGALNRVEPEADRLVVEYINGDHDYYKPGSEFPLSQTYCIAATDIKEAASVSNPAEEGFDDLAVYEEFGVESYLGTYIPVDGGVDRTFAFIGASPRVEPFSREDRAYLELMGQWVKYELDHRQYQQELEETITQVQKSNNRLKQFAYAASHDLQEPLRMVSSYLQLLDSEYEDEFDEEAREYVDYAVDGAERMRGMVEDLLAFSRIENDEHPIEPVDCNVITDRVMADLQVQLEEANAAVSIDELPSVRANDEQLEQLFRNLLSNAVKYNEDDPRVEISVADRNDHWEFAVVDNGIGIDPNKTDRIFEVFKRLHHSDDYSGTGIGLSLCQEIVNNHGGDIWVESEPGEGSTFSFTLPKQVSS